MAGHFSNDGVPVLCAGHGDHLCCAYDSRAEQEELAIDFVRAGLGAGDRIWYFTDTADPAEILALLRGAGVAVDEPLRSGQLLVTTAQDGLLRAGAFVPDQLLAELGEAVGAALDDGFAGLRLTSELGWATGRLSGWERLDEFELNVDRMFPGLPLTALCQYDRRLFDSERLERLLALHPLQARLPRVSHDGLLRISREEVDGAVRLRVAGEADLTGAAVLDQALSYAARSGEDILIDASRLEFLDGAGARRLIEAASELRPARRLYLQRPTPAVRSLFDRFPSREDMIRLLP